MILAIRNCRVVALGVAFALCFFFAGVPKANANGVGVSVNGICQVGSCPPIALPLGTGVTQPYSFAVTLGNGDSYRIAGTISASVNAEGNFVPATQIFTVT